MSNDSTTFFSLVWAGVSTVITALSAALTYMFKLRENENSKNITKLEAKVDEIQKKSDACEEDRSTLFTQCEVLKTQLENVKEKMERMDLNGTDYSHKNIPKDPK